MQGLAPDFVQRGIKWVMATVATLVAPGSDEYRGLDWPTINRNLNGVQKRRPYRMTKGLAGVSPQDIQTVLVSRYWSIASMPFSRPRPEAFTPPKGAR